MWLNPDDIDNEHSGLLVILVEAWSKTFIDIIIFFHDNQWLGLDIVGLYATNYLICFFLLTARSIYQHTITQIIRYTDSLSPSLPNKAERHEFLVPFM